MCSNKKCLEKLEEEVYATIKKLGLPTDFKLELKPFSKRYLGRYNPNNSKLIIYYLNDDKNTYDIDYLMENVIHECIHHYQWKHDRKFVRLRGIMHDEQFKMLEKKYINKYNRLKKRGVINVTTLENNLVKINDLPN